MNQTPTKSAASSSKTEADRGESTSASGTQIIPQDVSSNTSANSTTRASTSTALSTSVPRLPFGPVQEASPASFTPAMGTILTDVAAHKTGSPAGAGWGQQQQSVPYQRYPSNANATPSLPASPRAPAGYSSSAGAFWSTNASARHNLGNSSGDGEGDSDRQ